MTKCLASLSIKDENACCAEALKELAVNFAYDKLLLLIQQAETKKGQANTLAVDVSGKGGIFYVSI